jgi:hypothetical protein
MIIIHAVQKLFNTSKMEGKLYVSEPSDGQWMHSWYARLLASGFQGKALVIYVHDPSQLAVICTGRTIKSTWPEFQTRMRNLLTRWHFQKEFIERELCLANGYVMAKTNSKSMLGYINTLTYHIQAHCQRFTDFNDLPIDYIENTCMTHPYKLNKKLTAAHKYWEYQINPMLKPPMQTWV